MSGIFAMLVVLFIVNTWYVWIFLALHILTYILFLKFIAPKKLKGWGTVYVTGNKEPIEKVVVRLFSKQYNKLVDFHVTDKKGRYAFLVGPSEYIVSFEKEEYEARREFNLTNIREEKTLIKEDVRLTLRSGNETKERK